MTNCFYPDSPPSPSRKRAGDCVAGGLRASCAPSPFLSAGQPPGVALAGDLRLGGVAERMELGAERGGVDVVIIVQQKRR